MEQAKRAAGFRAAEMIGEEDLVIGVGTGSTVAYFLEALRDKGMLEGRLFIPSSLDTALKLREMGARLLSPHNPGRPDVYVDGADEVDGEGNMIKGRGGAHVGEKILAHVSRRNIFIVDESKLVGVLGEKKPLPLEVLPQALPAVLTDLEAMGYRAVVRRSGCKDGPCISDGGGILMDVYTGPIRDPEGLEARLLRIPGVVDTGLFIGYADIVVVGRRDGSAVARRYERRRGILHG